MKPERPADRMMAVLAMPLSHRQARVLAVLAFHDGPGGASPALARIAREAGLKHRARAAETVAELEGLGVLTRRRGKHANTYEVDYEWHPQCPRKPDTEPAAPQCPRKPDSVGDGAPRHSVRDSRSTVSAKAGHEPEEPEGTPSAPPRAEGVPTPSAAREGAAPPGRSPPEGQRPSGAPADPDAPPWRLPLVRTIEGGRAAETPKEGMQEDGGAADVEATLERLRSGASADDPSSEGQAGRQPSRLDKILVGLGESILTKQGGGTG